jgi:hypothetical protein
MRGKGRRAAAAPDRAEVSGDRRRAKIPGSRRRGEAVCVVRRREFDEIVETVDEIVERGASAWNSL